MSIFATTAMPHFILMSLTKHSFALPKVDYFITIPKIFQLTIARFLQLVSENAKPAISIARQTLKWLYRINFVQKVVLPGQILKPLMRQAFLYAVLLIYRTV